jgi:hypothetical protein
MKEMNSLENHLRSWQPRRPSARLKQRLFATPTNIAADLARFLSWLAPAAACALLTLMVFNSGNSGGSSRHEPMVAMILSNQSYAAYASDSFGEEQNNLSSVTFNWTNHSGLTSTIGSFLRAQ